MQALSISRLGFYLGTLTLAAHVPVREIRWVEKPISARFIFRSKGGADLFAAKIVHRNGQPLASEWQFGVITNKTPRKIDRAAVVFVNAEAGKGAELADTTQMARILRLAHDLSSRGRGIIVARYADEIGTLKRNVYRDLKTIEAAGFPVQHDESRFWLPRNWWTFTFPGIEPDEVLALFAARQLMGSASSTRSGKGLERLWAKLSARNQQSALLPSSEGIMSVRGPGSIDYSRHRKTIETLERAVQNREAIWCRFRRSRTGEVTERIIEPGQLHFDAVLESLYCVAWCRLRSAVRIFAVHRFLETRGTGERFPFRADTRSRAALQGAFRVWRSENVQEVQLVFSAAVAAEIRERRWHPSQTLEELDDGRLVLRIQVAEPEELKRWLMGFGSAVVVIEPYWLADEIKTEHAEAAQKKRPKASDREKLRVQRNAPVLNAEKAVREPR